MRSGLKETFPELFQFMLRLAGGIALRSGKQLGQSLRCGLISQHYTYVAGFADISSSQQLKAHTLPLALYIDHLGRIKT